MKYFCIACLLFLFSDYAKAYEPPVLYNDSLPADSSSYLSSGSSAAVKFSSHAVSADSLGNIHWKKKKKIAAFLALPLPFGIIGLHRIYLGTKPYMPFVYIGTLGGCLGLLPLIDFIAIISAKEQDMNDFQNNPKAIMWAR